MRMQREKINFTFEKVHMQNRQGRQSNETVYIVHFISL
jgi:hypothetical protein